MIKTTIKLCFLFLILQQNLFSQCNLNTQQQYDVRAKIGDIITIAWDAPPTNSALLYYRIRRASIISGLYPVWVTVPFDKTQYTFTVTGPYFYFVTAWYSVIENGVSVARESTGSNLVRVRIVK